MTPYSCFFIGVLQLKKSAEQKTNEAVLDNKQNPTEAEERAANDRYGNSEYDEEDEDELEETDIDKISWSITKSMKVEDGSGSAAKSQEKPYPSKTKMNVQRSVLPEVCFSELNYIV